VKLSETEPPIKDNGHTYNATDFWRAFNYGDQPFFEDLFADFVTSWDILTYVSKTRSYCDVNLVLDLKYALFQSSEFDIEWLDKSPAPLPLLTILEMAEWKVVAEIMSDITSNYNIGPVPSVVPVSFHVVNIIRYLEFQREGNKARPTIPEVAVDGDDFHRLGKYMHDYWKNLTGILSLQKKLLLMKIGTETLAIDNIGFAAPRTLAKAEERVWKYLLKPKAWKTFDTVHTHPVKQLPNEDSEEYERRQRLFENLQLRTGQDGQYKLAQLILSSLGMSQREKVLNGPLDLDARVILSHKVFKVTPTKELSEHLTVTSGPTIRILHFDSIVDVYPLQQSQLPKYTSFRAPFNLFSSAGFDSLFVELLYSHILFFGHAVTKPKPSVHDSNLEYQISLARAKYRHFGSIPLLEELCDVYLPKITPEGLRFEDFPIYGTRLQNIQTEIKEWEPDTLYTKLFVPRYHDKITFYAFWLGGVITVVTILSFGATLAQTYVAFKALT
jgi:hypothetical protein